MNRYLLQITTILLALAAIFLVLSPARADTATYTYDDVGRLIKADYGMNATIFKYDAAGNITEITTGPDLSCPFSLALDKQENT